MTCAHCHQERAPASGASVLCRLCRDLFAIHGLRFCPRCHQTRPRDGQPYCKACAKAIRDAQPKTRCLKCRRVTALGLLDTSGHCPACRVPPEGEDLRRAWEAQGRREP